ncbi:MAG: TolC family protein [Acidobacteria bacterium]|nr:TolC family protein [Acidobacteriota bacterium]
MARMMRPRRHKEFCRLAGLPVIAKAGGKTCGLLLVFLLAGGRGMAQQPNREPRDYSKSSEWFPRFYRPYMRQEVPAVEPADTAIISRMIRDGKIMLSLADLLSAVVENNLDVAVARYLNSAAETDILRAKAGQAPRGVEGAPIPSGLFAGAIGAGVGEGGGGAGGLGGGGGISGQARAVSLSPRGAFDPTLVLNFSLGHTSSPLNTVRIAGVPVVTTSTTSFQARYQQAFTSGTTLSLTFSSQRQGSTQQSLLFNPSLVSRYSLSVTQNLLSGFGFAVNRRFLEVARNNQQTAHEVFRQRVIGVVAQAQNLYWDLIASRENVQNAERSLAVAEQLYEDNRKRVTIGTMAPVDLIPAESEVASRRRDLVIAQTDFQTQELALKNLFGKQMDPQLAAAPIEATDALPEPKDTDIPKLDEVLLAAMQNRPELRQAERSLVNQRTVVRFTRNSLRPTLTLFGLLASAGLAGDHVIPNPAGGPPIVIREGLGEALRQVGRLSFPEYAFGFTLSVPIKNRDAQADHVRARLDEQQAQTSLQQTGTQIALEVQKAIISLVQNQARVEAARRAVKLSEQALDAEEKKLRAGISTPYDVIRLQRDLVASQRAEVQARVNYAKALVEMARATGTSLDQANISLEKVLRGIS